jgi:Xaa-Pro aminopeptidase
VVVIREEEYASRRERLGALLEERGLEAIFVPPGSDLEYLTGIERDLPTFGQISYAHGWVAGAFLAPGQEPVYVLPRMVVAYHLDGVAPPRSTVVHEDGDGRASFAEAVGEIGSPTKIALGQRVWAEIVIELLEVVPEARFSQGSSLVNELRRVKSPAELELMSHACLIAREAMDAVVPDVVAGVSMTTLVERVEHELRVRGSRSPSFPTHIFTWGERRLDSDGAGKLDALQAGEIVLFDFGAVWQGYCSDFGRTVACGKPPRD